jgi:glycosyltransferase involved in cell wall biosynthesis
VGRITECKGHHLLLRALAALPAEMRAAVRLLVVGAEAPGCEADIAYARKLRADARAYEIDGQILWVGHQADLQPFYAAMDVLVHPALLEGMCIAILEALDCGIPVIAFNTGGIPEVVRDGHNGMLVPSIDEHALCRTLKLFLENRELRETLRAGARCGLDPRFSMDAFTAAVRAVVEDVCPLDRAGEAPVLAQGARR